jgi:hypothetical protein
MQCLSFQPASKTTQYRGWRLSRRTAKRWRTGQFFPLLNVASNRQIAAVSCRGALAAHTKQISCKERRHNDLVPFSVLWHWHSSVCTGMFKESESPPPAEKCRAAEVAPTHQGSALPALYFILSQVPVCFEPLTRTRTLTPSDRPVAAGGMLHPRARGHHFALRGVCQCLALVSHIFCLVSRSRRKLAMPGISSCSWCQ